MSYIEFMYIAACIYVVVAERGGIGGEACI